MQISELRTNVIVRGPVLPEPVQVIRVVPMGVSVKLVGRGLTTGMVHQPILSAAQLASLEASPETQPFDGDPKNFKLGVEALRLGIPTSTTPTSRCPSRALTRCRTNWKLSTTTS